MPCAAGELCTLQELTPTAPDGHECHGGCRDRLHGICGDVEQEGGNELQRICPKCTAALQNIYIQLPLQLVQASAKVQPPAGRGRRIKRNLEQQKREKVDPGRG